MSAAASSSQRKIKPSMVADVACELTSSLRGSKSPCSVQLTLYTAASPAMIGSRIDIVMTSSLLLIFSTVVNLVSLQFVVWWWGGRAKRERTCGVDHHQHADGMSGNYRLQDSVILIRSVSQKHVSSWAHKHTSAHWQ